MKIRGSGTIFYMKTIEIFDARLLVIDIISNVLETRHLI